jgi:hypothetical protein
MVEMHSLLRNARLEHIAERVPKILMEKVSVGLDTIVRQILPSLSQPIPGSFHKDSVMKSKSHVVPALIKIDMELLIVSIVSKVLSVLTSK